MNADQFTWNSLRNFVLSAIPEDEEIERFKKNPLKLFDSKRPEHAE